MTGTDYTGFVFQWLQITQDVDDENEATSLLAGFQWGLALAARHPEYAASAHAELGKDYRERLGGDEMSFEMMAVASGDTRTAPEAMADELAEACPLPPHKT